MNHLHFHFSSGLETWVHTCAPIQFRGVRRSVVLRDSLWPLCWAFRNLTQRTRRIATKNTEAQGRRIEIGDGMRERLLCPTSRRNVCTANTLLVSALPRCELRTAIICSDPAFEGSHRN